MNSPLTGTTQARRTLLASRIPRVWHLGLAEGMHVLRSSMLFRIQAVSSNNACPKKDLSRKVLRR